MLPVAATVGRASSSPAWSCISRLGGPRLAERKAQRDGAERDPRERGQSIDQLRMERGLPGVRRDAIGPHGSDTWKVIAFAGSNPIFALRRFQKLRPSSPAATSSTSAIATWKRDEAVLRAPPPAARRRPRRAETIEQPGHSRARQRDEPDGGADQRAHTRRPRARPSPSEGRLHEDAGSRAP